MQADSGLAVAYQRTGTLQVATTDDGLREVSDAAAHLETQGLGGRLLDAQAYESKNRPSATTWSAGSWFPRTASLRPARWSVRLPRRRVITARR